MFAIRYVSSLWNNFWHPENRPDDAPIIDEPGSPLASRTVEKLRVALCSPEQSQAVIPSKGGVLLLPPPASESNRPVQIVPRPDFVPLDPIDEEDTTPPAIQYDKTVLTPLHIESCEENGQISTPVLLPDSEETEEWRTLARPSDALAASPLPQIHSTAAHEQIQEQEALIAEWRAELGPKVDALVSPSMHTRAFSSAELAMERARIHAAIKKENGLAHQEDSFNILREEFGAARVDEILADTPHKVYTATDLKKLYQRLRREALAETDQFRASLSKFGDEAQRAVPRRTILLTAAQKADTVAKLEYFAALKRQFDARAVEAVLPEYRSKAELTSKDKISLLAKIGTRHYALLEQDKKIQKLAAAYSAPVALERDLLTPEAMAEKEARLALAQLDPEDRNFLLRLAEDEPAQLAQVASNPEAFLKFADEAVADAGRQEISGAHFGKLMAARSDVACGLGVPEYHKIEPDAALMQRLQAAKNLPLKARIAILREITRRMENAKVFWQAARERFELYYPKERVEEIVALYFSRYAQGLQPLRLEALEKIEWILQRQRTASEIADACAPLLRLSETDGANQPVDTELMKEAVEVQLDFERNLHLREEYDLTCSLCGLIRSETLLLESLQTLSDAQIDEFSAQLSPKEKALVAGVKNKAKAQKIPFGQALEETLQGHRALLAAKEGSLERCRMKIDDDSATNLASPAIDSLSPNGPRMTFILALADFHRTKSPAQLMNLFQTLTLMTSQTQDLAKKRNFETFRIHVALEIFRAAGNQAPVEILLKAIHEEMGQLAGKPGSEDRLGRLESYALALTGGMARIAAELKEERELSPQMKGFHVVPLGNVLFRGVRYNEDTEKDELTAPTGKWAVLDLRHTSEASRAAIVQQLPPERLEQILQGKQPYEAVSFDLVQGKLVPRADKRGAIRVFYESPKMTFVNHEDRDFGERSRLVRKSRATRDQHGHRWPDMQHGDYARLQKEPLRKDETEWSKARMMTAAVDRQIVVQGARLAAEAVLRGASAGLFRDYQHLREFFDAVQGSDIAKMKGSYSEDPIFNRSFNLFMHQGQRLAGADRTRVPVLQSALGDTRKRSREMESLMQVAGITAFYRAWIQDIRAMQNLARTNEAFRDQFSWFIAQIGAVLPHVERFLSRFPAELSQLEQIMQEIQSQTRKFPEAPAVMERFGKSPEEVRQMLKNSLEKISYEFKIMKMAFKDLQVAESSARVQQERTERLKKLFPSNGALQAQIGDAVGRILNGMTKVTLALDEILRKNITELSPLREQVAEAFAGASEQIFQGELLRSQEKQNKMGQMSEEQAVASYFPPPPKKKAAAVLLPPPSADLELAQV